MSQSKVRVRFAPSPTGYLHIGGVRTALFNWLFARHEGGEFLLRIEDTDQTRHTEDAIGLIYEGLRWLGMTWDGEVLRQSDRREIYRKAAERLLERGLAYRCYCTPDELEQMRKEHSERGGNFGYDGRCRNRTEFPPDQPYCIRFKVTGDEPVEFEDMVYGKIRVERRELDDLVILKTDGLPSYNFANVVDDSDMGITHVIRGDDHINNTPRQIAIYQALEFEPPRFAHLPMIVDENRKKLSKRHSAANVLQYREEGYLPEAILNYIAKLGWGLGDQEFFTVEELIEKFNLERVNKAACAIDTDKLAWLAGKHMEQADSARLGQLWREHLKAKGALDSARAEKFADAAWLGQVVETLKIRAKTISDMTERGEFYFAAPAEYEEKGAKKFLKPEVAPAIEDLKQGLEALPEPLEESALESLFAAILEKHSLKMLKLAQPLRIFLTGGTASPGIFDMIRLLGRPECLHRIDRGLEFMKTMEGQ